MPEDELKVMKRAITATAAILFYCVTFATASVQPVQADEDPLDLKSIPVSDWLNAGDHAQIPWDFRVSEPYLRVDRRVDVSDLAGFSGKDLNRIGNPHELFFSRRVSSPDGEWLEEASVSRPVAQ